MESQEDLCNSLPYIDDTLIDDDTNPHQYNLKIIENYHNENRNIEIINRFFDERKKSFNHAAPLADENEFSDNKLSNSTEENNCKQDRKFNMKESGMKLVIKGWNSSVSIQSLDNKSFITYKRRCEKVREKVEGIENKGVGDEAKVEQKSRKGKWKMLTRSIMLAKSARFERKGLDERYPKYVLLKNEEEEELTKVKENYPKMFLFNEENLRQKRNAKPKIEFSFKKSFKNKTEPILPLEDIVAKTEKVQPEKPKIKQKENIKKHKKPITERNMSKKKTVERRKSLAFEKKAEEPIQSIIASPLSHGQVCNEIQNIFEDTLKLLPQGVELQQRDEGQHQPEKPEEYYTCEPPRHGPHCCLVPQHQPIHTSEKAYMYKNSNNQFNYSCQNQEIRTEEQTAMDGVLNLESLPFGILSSFFPRVVIMNAIPCDEIQKEDETAVHEAQFRNYQLPIEEVKKEHREVDESLKVPQPDPRLKAKALQEVELPEPQDFCLEKVSLKEFSVLDEGQKTKSQGSETTEYLQYSEFDPPENESVDRPSPTTPSSKNDSQEKENESHSQVNKFEIDEVDENSENLLLTKIGYKMYDNLTKLSLNREKEMSKESEASGCGCNGNGTKKSLYNITLESNNSLVKVTVPENELDFQIFDYEEGGIQIEVMSGRKKKADVKEIKKIVRKEELWHTDGERQALVLKNENWEADISCIQKFKVSLADNKEIVLSIGKKEKGKKEKKLKEKSTREMKVGTDDFDIAGGDFVCTLEGNCTNLSPRIGQLLKHLHEKLEADGKERKFLDEKINQKLIDQKYQGNTLPGLFLVKHISPRTHAIQKPLKVSAFRKPNNENREPAGPLREYYCEECLATMRIIEDENPSVKSMVDKFETIFQLESY